MNQDRIESLRLNRIRLGVSDAIMHQNRWRLMVNQVANANPGRGNMANAYSSYVNAFLQLEEGKTTVRLNLLGSKVAYELQVEQEHNVEAQRYSDIRMRVAFTPLNTQEGVYCYYGPAGLVIQLGTCRTWTNEDRQQSEPLRVIPKELPSPAMEINMNIKAFRRMLNGVAKANNGVFSLASHEGRWNVFSDTPTTVGTRWRVTPTIYSSAIGGVRYKTLYDFFFRKKTAVRGAFAGLDEDTEITLTLRDNGELVVSLRPDEASLESFVFEPEPSIMDLLEVLEGPNFELPFMGREATVTEEPEEVTAVETEEPTEEVEEPAQEAPSFSYEEGARMVEWREASVRHQQAVGAPTSESPQIWFSHYMMERLRQGEAIDDLDNQILAKL